MKSEELVIIEGVDKDLQEKANKLCYAPNILYLTIQDRERFVRLMAHTMQKIKYLAKREERMKDIDKDLIKTAEEIADGCGYLECGYDELIERIAQFAQSVRNSAKRTMHANRK